MGGAIPESPLFSITIPLFSCVIGSGTAQEKKEKTAESAKRPHAPELSH
jgi:hypothetical protein